MNTYREVKRMAKIGDTIKATVDIDNAVVKGETYKIVNSTPNTGEVYIDGGLGMLEHEYVVLENSFLITDLINNLEDGFVAVGNIEGKIIHIKKQEGTFYLYDKLNRAIIEPVPLTAPILKVQWDLVGRDYVSFEEAFQALKKGKRVGLEYMDGAYEYELDEDKEVKGRRVGYGWKYYDLSWNMMIKGKWFIV